MATTPTNNLSRLFQTAGTAKPQQGTGYTNLNRLFEANKQNQLGQKVAGDLGGQIGGVQTQLQQQQKQFTEESEKNKVGGQKDVEQREAVLGRFSSASGAGDQVTEDETKAFGRFTAGQYGGPESLKDTSGLRQTAQQLQGQVSNFSPSGTQELLRQSVGGNRYTQGQSRLDSLLMDRSKLTPVARQAQGLGQEIQRADLAAQGLAEANKNAARQFGQETQQKLQGALTGLDVEAQAQLTAARNAENDRLARVQAIQDFAAGKVAQKDANGNVIKDAYGNIQYSTNNARGATDAAGQLDYLKNLLSSQGAQQSEIDQLLGSGNFAQGQSQYNSDLSDIQKQQLNQATYEQILTNPRIANELMGKYGVLNPDYNSDFGGSMYNGLDAERLKKDLASGAFDPNSVNWYNSTDDSGDSDLRNLGTTSQQNYSSYNNFYDPQRQYAAQNFYGTRGLAGQALQGGNLDALYANLGKTVGNSAAAQNLTLQGVASEPIRNNYTALQQLLGQTSDLTKYTGDPTYQAGNLLLNPNQLRKSLGY